MIYKPEPQTYIECDYCDYEEPNNYYDGVKNWVFSTDLEEDEQNIKSIKNT